jgi:hypothetical protein
VPLDRLLERRGIGLEDSEVLRQAFNRHDPICEIVARKIIEIGVDGTRDPQVIAARTIRQLGP